MTFQAGFVILLASQLTLLGNYNYQPDYQNGYLPSLPLFNPKLCPLWPWLPSVPSLIFVPDNACMRTYFGSPTYCGSSENKRRLNLNRIQTIFQTAPTFDFIVVGSGAGGATVASRLSEKYKVLLIEAGSDPTAQPVVSCRKLTWPLLINYFAHRFHNLFHLELIALWPGTIQDRCNQHQQMPLRMAVPVHVEEPCKIF